MSPPVRLDLHVHSPDSTLAVERIADRLERVGLRGFALTDHNSVAGLADLAGLRSRFPNYLFVPGVEVSTAQGHLLAYGIDVAPPPRKTLGETIGWVLERGGVPVVAHPFRWTHGAGAAGIRTPRLVGLESANGHCRQSANARGARSAAPLGLATTGGSDAHALADIGRAYTEFSDKVATVPDVLDAIREGRTEAWAQPLGLAGQARWLLRTSIHRIARGFRSV